MDPQASIWLLRVEGVSFLGKKGLALFFKFKDKKKGIFGHLGLKYRKQNNLLREYSG